MSINVWTYMWDKVQEGISTECAYCKGNQEAEQEVKTDFVYEWY